MKRRRIVHSDLRVTNSAKWQCPVITQGYTSIPGTHFVLKSGGGDEAQQQCLIHGVVHFKRDRKYVMRSGRSTIAGFAVAVAKQFTPLRDASGRPAFSGSSDTCSADPASFGVLLRLLQHYEENPGLRFALLPCSHVEGIPVLCFAPDVMFSAILQEHACYHVVLAEVLVLFPVSDVSYAASKRFSVQDSS